MRPRIERPNAPPCWVSVERSCLGISRIGSCSALPPSAGYDTKRREPGKRPGRSRRVGDPRKSSSQGPPNQSPILVVSAQSHVVDLDPDPYGASRIKALPVADQSTPGSILRMQTVGSDGQARYAGLPAVRGRTRSHVGANQGVPPYNQFA